MLFRSLEDVMSAFSLKVEYNRRVIFLIEIGSLTDNTMLPANRAEAASCSFPFKTKTSCSRFFNLISNNGVDLEDDP